MFDVNAWLTERLASGQPRHERLCFLFMANGGTEVHGWGVISSYPNGHQRGLGAQDAYELVQHAAFIAGLHAGGVPVEVLLNQYLDAYKSRFDAEHAAPQEHVTAVSDAALGLKIVDTNSVEGLQAQVAFYRQALGEIAALAGPCVCANRPADIEPGDWNDHAAGCPQYLTFLCGCYLTEGGQAGASGKLRVRSAPSVEPQEHTESDVSCTTCDEEGAEDVQCFDGSKCAQAKRDCGHHCNHVWTHDVCCWCGYEASSGA